MKRNVPSAPRPKAGTTPGDRLRDLGMARAVSISTQSAVDYKLAYRQEFINQVALGQPFCSDQVVAVVGLPPAGCSPNMVGGIWNGLMREFGLVVHSRVKMARAQAHSRMTDLYVKP